MFLLQTLMSNYKFLHHFKSSEKSYVRKIYESISADQETRWGIKPSRKLPRVNATTAYLYLLDAYVRYEMLPI